MRWLSNPILQIGCAVVLGSVGARAQAVEPGIALKSGETTELGIAYFVANCRSILVSTPEVEVLEGPSELVLTIKEGMVLPSRYNCANKVAGGTVVAAAKDIKEVIHSRLTYRIKYKTKIGDRQSSYVYNVSLFP